MTSIGKYSVIMSPDSSGRYAKVNFKHGLEKKG